MKRRDVLKAGAVGAVGVGAASMAGGGGCATVPRNPAHVEAEVNAFLALLDDQLDIANGAKAVERTFDNVSPGPRRPDVQQKIEANDALFRKMLRSLFITQSFRDQPYDTQIHPAVQDRMFSHLDEIEGTMFELTDFLAGQTSDERTKLRDKLREHPDTAMRLGEEIDRRAHVAGVSKNRRKQLKQIMTQVAFRLKTEGPESVIDEYTAKVERLRADGGKNATAMAIAERMGQRAFWKYQQYQQGAPPQPYPPPPPTAQPAPPANPQPPTQPAGPPPGPPVQQPPPGRPIMMPPPQPMPMRPRKHPGSGALKAGAYMLGIGVVALGIGAVAVDSAEGFGLVSITVGSILVSVGFIVLIIGALIYAAN